MTYLHEIDGQTWFKEQVTDEIGHALRVDKLLFEGEIDHQHIAVFENERFGRLFALNGFIQLSTADEFIYHEMVSHVPLFEFGAAKRVLVIGGGDGGVIREVLRHEGVETVTLVEIERDVIEFSKRWFPDVGGSAWDDPRLDLQIADGAKFVKEASRQYDVIIVDSTDPVGPGEVLFTEEFYADCHARLSENGIMVSQCGLPFLQPAELKKAHDNQAKSFASVQFYTIAVPAYSGGLMALGFARKGGVVPAEGEIASAVQRAGLAFRYYTPEGHRAAFALPAYVRRVIETGTFGEGHEAPPTGRR